MKNICFLIIICFITIFMALCQTVQGDKQNLSEDQARKMQENLKNAMQELKKEIKIEVTIENGGAIAGNVTCKRIRYPENVVVFIEEVGDNDYPAPEEHGIIDQFNLTFVPHVLAVQKGTVIDFPNSDAVRHNVFSPPDCCKQLISVLTASAL